VVTRNVSHRNVHITQAEPFESRKADDAYATSAVPEYSAYWRQISKSFIPSD
jgi:hypothetical protein